MNQCLQSNELIGQRIRRLRKEREVSQHVLAKKCGVTDSWLSQIEQDKVTPSATLLNNIAAVLQVPVSDLLHEVDEQMEIASRIKLIEVLLETQQPEEAESTLAKLKNHPELTESHQLDLRVHLAECKYQQQQYREALAILEPLIRSLESKNHHDAYLLANVRNKIGNNFFLLRDYTNAFYNYKKAYDYTLRFETPDPLAGRIAFNVAYVLRTIGQLTEADSYLELSYRNCHSVQDLQQLGKTFYEKGMLFSKKMEYGKAAECFDQAKTVFQSINLRSFCNIVQDTYASEITSHLDPSLAIAQLEQCIRSHQEEKMIDRVLLLYVKMASIQLKNGQHERARDHLQIAVEMIQTHALDKTPEAAECLNVYALYLFHCQKYLESIDYSFQSSELFASLGLIKDQVYSLQLAADAYEKIGNPEQAIAILKNCTQLLSNFHEGESVR